MLARLIAQHDGFHAPPLSEPWAAWHKEWHHFCILGPTVQVILNLNLSGDTRPAAEPGAQLARSIVLVRDHSWDGDVDTIPPRDVGVWPGAVDVRFGHNTVSFREGQFELSFALQDRPVALTLHLRPLAQPLLMRSNTPIGAGTINWLVVPRLAATGLVTVGQRVYRLEEAPAYHDHNWGRWLWGHDFAWEWGFALPDQADLPWSLVFDRTTNRSRGRVLELTLALWKDTQLQRVFTQHEVQVRSIGYLTPAPVPKFPRVMALIAPERTTDIPLRLAIRAAAGGDHLSGTFEAQDIAQIVIPNETDLGVTIINEVTGQLELTGEVRGEPVMLRGRAIFEFLTC